MKRTHVILLSLIGLLCAVFVVNEAAEAARMGGGKSFGSSPSYQRSAPAPSPSTGSPASPGIVAPGADDGPLPHGRALGRHAGRDARWAA